VPIAGFTSFRRHQVGKQSAILTPVAATRVLPYRGPIVINPNRTQPDVDDGSLDPIMAPFNGPKDVTGTWDGKLAFNDLPYTLAAAGKGGETSSGATAKTWVFDYASLTADSFEYLTDEWGDDTNASDGIQAYGGVIDSYTVGFPETLEAFDLSAQLIYANANMATARTGALTLDTSPTWVYGADTELFVDTTAGGLGGTKWTDAVHALTWNWQNNLDRKRFANGSGTRFSLAGYGRAERTIDLVVTLAHTTQTMAEAATLDDDPVPARYIRMKATSPTIITGAIPYSWQRDAAMRLISRTDGEIGGNTTIILTYRAFYDSTLTYAVQDTVVNTLTAL